MSRTTARGFTLLELMVTVAITSIVMIFAVQAFVIMDRGRRPRQFLAKIQTDGRHGVGKLEDEIRTAATGVGTGVVWTVKDGLPVARPAVQIFDNVAGAGVLNAKAGTDAILIVRPVPRRVLPDTRVLDAVPVLASQMPAPMGDLPLTTTGDLYDGCNALVGDGSDAVWVPITAVRSAGTEHVAVSGLTVPVLPGAQATKLGAGTAVRLAAARLYYVNPADELVRLDLAVPRPPIASAEILGGMVVATGVENLQLDCTAEVVNVMKSCQELDPVTSDVVPEAAVAFGEGGNAPRFDMGNIGSLRTVTASVVLRSPQIREPQLADDPVDNLAPGAPTLGVGPQVVEFPVITADSKFMRRAYRLGAAVRNVSLGVY